MGERHTPCHGGTVGDRGFLDTAMGCPQGRAQSPPGRAAGVTQHGLGGRLVFFDPWEPGGVSGKPEPRPLEERRERSGVPLVPTQYSLAR